MHRGRVILGAVLSGALTVAVATQVASWSPAGPSWDGYGPTLPPRTPTSQPLPADATIPPECLAGLEAAQQSGATLFACANRVAPQEDCTPAYVEVHEHGRPPKHVQQTCQ